MRTVDIDRIRTSVGEAPCADCGSPSDTFTLNEKTTYLCHGCLAVRHENIREDVKANPGTHMQALMEAMS